MKLCVFAFLLALALPIGATAQERCLPYQSGDGGSPVISARVKGQGPFAFVLDTAASGSTLDERTIARLGLARDVETEEAQGLGGAFNVRLFRVPSLDAGQLVLKDAIVPETPAPAFESHDIVGLAGIDLLGEWLTIWRPETMCVGLAPSGVRPDGKDWTAAAAVWMRPWKILLPVRIGSVDGLALLDTGAQRSVLNSAFANRLQLTEASGRLRPGGEITGLDGRPLTLFEAQIGGSSIGPWTWADAMVAVGDLPVFFRLGDPDQPLMVLGMDWLAGRSFAVDYGARKVWLRAAPATS